MAMPVMDVGALSVRQQERRARMLEVALELASEGGYEAVQMRDVAARAGVALGTLYRYFGSKDHLLAAAWSAWAGRLERTVTIRALRGTSMAEQTNDLFRRATRTIERNRRLGAAIVLAAASNDAQAAVHQREVGAMIGRILTPVMASLEPEIVRGILDVLNHVWYSALLQWVGGRRSMAGVYVALEEAAHLLLDPRER
jgi:AcrR family transcriptional regulator